MGSLANGEQKALLVPAKVQLSGEAQEGLEGDLDLVRCSRLWGTIPITEHALLQEELLMKEGRRDQEARSANDDQAQTITATLGLLLPPPQQPIPKPRAPWMRDLELVPYGCDAPQICIQNSGPDVWRKQPRHCESPKVIVGNPAGITEGRHAAQTIRIMADEESNLEVVETSAPRCHDRPGPVQRVGWDHRVHGKSS